MQKPEQRAEPRIAVTFNGTLTLNGVSMPCTVQNMCSRGFLIKHSNELPVGQALHLTCDLPARSVECTVQVRHVNPHLLGARVTEMSEEDRRACLRFLEERRATT